jgi:hypothetical protein
MPQYQGGCGIYEKYVKCNAKYYSEYHKGKNDFEDVDRDEKTKKVLNWRSKCWMSGLETYSTASK